MNNKIVKVVHGDTGNLDYLKKFHYRCLVGVPMHKHHYLPL